MKKALALCKRFCAVCYICEEIPLETIELVTGMLETDCEGADAPELPAGAFCPEEGEDAEADGSSSGWEAVDEAYCEETGRASSGRSTF